MGRIQSDTEEELGDWPFDHSFRWRDPHVRQLNPEADHFRPGRYKVRQRCMSFARCQSHEASSPLREAGASTPYTNRVIRNNFRIHWPAKQAHRTVRGRDDIYWSVLRRLERQRPDRPCGGRPVLLDPADLHHGSSRMVGHLWLVLRRGHRWCGLLRTPQHEPQVTAFVTAPPGLMPGRAPKKLEGGLVPRPPSMCWVSWRPRQPRIKPRGAFPVWRASATPCWRA